MSDDVSSDPQQWKAAQEALDSSRGDFTHQAPATLSALESAQTAAKWGEESGPVTARQQYTESIADMQQQITQYNADLIAFIDAMAKTRENFTENEYAGQQAANSMVGLIDAGQEDAVARSEAEIKAVKEASETAGKMASGMKMTAAQLTGLKSSLIEAMQAQGVPYYVSSPNQLPQLPQVTPFAAAGTSILTGAQNQQTWLSSPLPNVFEDTSKPGTVGHPEISTCPAIPKK